MKEHEGEFAVRLMCRVLSVSPSGHYDWRKRGVSRQAQARVELDAQVKAEFKARKGRAGAHGCHATSVADGARWRDEPAPPRSACEGGEEVQGDDEFEPHAAGGGEPVAAGLHGRAANQVWVGDITLIGTDEGWLYLAVVLDLYSRRVVGWSMSDRMQASLAYDALRMALFKRRRPRGIVMHTDRGSQYCSREHRDLLDEHGLSASMSARGNCYDNAAMESWNHSLKVEAIYGERFTTREEARAHVLEYIAVDYNRNRLHSTLGYLSPEQFELANAA